ncbi:transporter associated domain protein [Neorickettsia helminthoeca str. Oregon]|uniref:Transporter associated domain protein n=1 Tax=Neorickettsia helminthoeca str. Oregon TaxID=1286528 RepID=X5HLJ3_9RICK|nr:transporter associated domain-containing protein [Neorickettsia helminthoeca]AHX11270.1 transporter associated domain protein [Neorickettsia helminthoeca str. Oregon]
MSARLCVFGNPILSFFKRLISEKPSEPVNSAGSLISKLDSIYVEDIMVERSKIVAIDVSIKSDDLRSFKEISHSRTPVFDGNLDKIIGFIHIKDVLNNVGNEFSIMDVLRKIICVPPSMKVSALLMKMKVAHVHMAIVVDEFGATVGIVTMTDVVEQILGDIHDEHDINSEPFLLRLSEHKFEVSARIEMKEFLDKSGLEFEVGDNFRTLGGYIFSIAGKVPSVGDIVTSPEGVMFSILDADNKRINVVLVDASNCEK